MERVVYCPSEAFLDESSLLSKKTNLPIVIGDSSHTLDLIFDRSNVQVLKIPQHHVLDYTVEPVKVGFHQCIYYINEFHKLRGSIQLFINDEKIESVYEETHKAKYLYCCSMIGEQVCEIHVNGKKIEDFSFYVN